jgi:hypothetical protein
VRRSGIVVVKKREGKINNDQAGSRKGIDLGTGPKTGRRGLVLLLGGCFPSSSTRSNILWDRAKIR